MKYDIEEKKGTDRKRIDEGQTIENVLKITNIYQTQHDTGIIIIEKV